MSRDKKILSEFSSDINSGFELSSDIPCIFLMGGIKTGKSSIEHVVFHSMKPYQTQLLRTTTDIWISKILNNGLIKFQILDFPGLFEFKNSEFKPNELFKYCNSLCFIIDSQDYKDSLKYILQIINLVVNINNKNNHKKILNNSLNNNNNSNDINDEGKANNLNGNNNESKSGDIITNGGSINTPNKSSNIGINGNSMNNSNKKSNGNTGNKGKKGQMRREIYYNIFINKMDDQNDANDMSEEKLKIQKYINNKLMEYFDMNNIDIQNNNGNLINNSHRIKFNYFFTSIFDNSIFESMSNVIQQLIPNNINKFLRNILSTFVTKCNIQKSFIFNLKTKLYLSSDNNQIYNDNELSLFFDIIDFVNSMNSIYADTNNNNNNNNNNNMDSNNSIDDIKQNNNDINNQQNGHNISENASKIATKPRANIELQANDIETLILKGLGRDLALVFKIKKNDLNENKGLIEYNFNTFQDCINKLFHLI